MAEEIIQQEQQESAATEQSLEQVIASNPAYREQYKAMLGSHKAEWERKRNAEQSEAEKLASMSAEQREKYQFTKEKEAFAKEQADFARQQLTLQMGTELQKRGLSSDFASMIVGKDAQQSLNNLNALEAHIKSEIQKGLNGVMRGKAAPRDAVPAAPAITSRDALKGMTPEQIVKAHREGRLDALMGK